MTYNKLTCLFGHHDYDDKMIPDEHGELVYLCKICKKSGHRKLSGGRLEIWKDYDEKGKCVHEKWNDGLETWFEYNEDGNCIHQKCSDGEKYWKANNGRWINRKPKNWKYDNV